MIQRFLLLFSLLLYHFFEYLHQFPKYTILILSRTFIVFGFAFTNRVCDSDISEPGPKQMTQSSILVPRLNLN